MVPVKAVVFDLGNTLVAYYRKEEFTPVLQRCIAALLEELQRRELKTPSFDDAIASALLENREAADYRFSPLLPRLARICGQPLAANLELGTALSAAFMQPIFATARRYDDAVPALQALRQQGYKTAIVSNSPWGSAPTLWRQELQRLGLAEMVDAIVMCGDVGWRKPAAAIFHHAARMLGVECEECMFVGDDVQWDVEGSAAVGMQPVLLDRAELNADFQGRRIVTLDQLNLVNDQN